MITFSSQIIVLEEVMMEVLSLVSENNTIYFLRRVCIIVV